MDLNIVGIIQARMGATRLPNKMMLYLHGYPIIEWIFRRLNKSKNIKLLIFAIPDTKDNDILENYLKKLKANVFRGSEINVLERFYKVASLYNASHVVRVCADNPLVDSNEIDKLIKFYFDNPCDYAYNHIPRNNLYPDGLGAEIVSINVLKKIYENAIDSIQKEHAFNFIWDNKDQFIIKTFDPDLENIKRPDVKLDIDNLSDYQKLLEMDINIDSSSSEVIEVYK